MTEERKEELRQLLNAAIASLEIRLNSVKNRHQLPPIINVNEYRLILQQYWIARSINFLSPETLYEPQIVNASTRSKLLDFIRKEFASFIHEDQIQSASFFIGGGPTSGYPLDYPLKQLLKVAIAFGVERAISDFDRCAENTSGSFQYIALLEGVKVEKEIQVYEGIRLIPLSNSLSELPHYLPHFLFTFPGTSAKFLGKTLLIIDFSISPIFCKPSLETFQVNPISGNFPSFNNADGFCEKFSRVLSLVCNSKARIALQWKFLAEHELFNLNTFSVTGTTGNIESIDTDHFERSIVVREAQIDEAKCLYKKLIKLDSRVREKLQIPIDRWIESKRDIDPVDKMIDLGIALESLFLSDIKERSELSFRFRLHASWHLGKDKEDRKRLLAEFKQIYDLRSKAVHSGTLRPTVKIAGNSIPIGKFIEISQDLCRDSIMKILEAGRFPDWNDLILG